MMKMNNLNNKFGVKHYATNIKGIDMAQIQAINERAQKRFSSKASGSENRLL